MYDSNLNFDKMFKSVFRHNQLQNGSVSSNAKFNKNMEKMHLLMNNVKNAL